jgi:hypothetical protein
MDAERHPTFKTDLPTLIQKGPVPNDDLTVNQLDPGEPTLGQMDTALPHQGLEENAGPDSPFAGLDLDLIQDLPQMSIDQWLEKLKGADRAFYNTMAMEVWSIAKSMDNLQPGFWAKFMVNRRSAMQQFVKQGRGPSLDEPTLENQSDTQTPE